MCESITQHITTKGGEFFSRELGIIDDFRPDSYLGEVTNIPPYNLILAADDTFVSFDSIARMWFTRMEVH